MTVRADNASYILVNESGQPVPLPFHTTHEGRPVTVIDGTPPEGPLVGTVVFKEGAGPRFTCPADWLGLEWITEAEYMEKQS